MYVYLINPVMT